MSAPAGESGSGFRSVVPLIVLIFSVTLSLHAQETGKIEGRIVAASSLQPIAGAQIVIVGTRIGNLSNADGYYFINNIPAGVQDVRVQFIGYQAVTLREQRILAGQTTTLNFQLSEAPVEIAGIEIVGEKRPLVPRDQLTSKNIVPGDVIKGIDNVNGIVRVQPGVVSNARKNGFSIRGGRAGEEAVYVDGVLLRNFAQGQTNLIIGTNTLTEVDVVTGGFGAQYGEAQSGIINYITRTGGSRWNGTLTVMSDEMMPQKYSTGFNRIEFSMGGPLIGRLGFFGGVTAIGQKSANLGREWRNTPIYVAQGIDTVISYDPTPIGAGDIQEVVIPNYVLYDRDGRIPFSNSDEYTADTKLDYTYGTGSRVFAAAKLSRRQGRNAFGGGKNYLFNSQGFGGSLARSWSGTLSWTHNIVSGTESGLAIDLKAVRSHDYAISGNLDEEFDLTHRSPAFGFTVPDFRFQVDEKSFPVDEALVEKWMHNVMTTPEQPGITPFPTTWTLLNGTTEYRLNPYAMFSNFTTRGVGGTFGFVEESQWQYRGSIDWQVDRKNRMKFGADYFDIDLARANITYNSASFGQLWVEHPKRQGLFAQERLDLGDIIVEAGLRYDRFDPNSIFPRVPGYLDPDDPETYAKAPVRSALSPRLGVAFPVTVNSTFRLSYGHFTQTPDLNLYYRGKNTNLYKYQNTNTNDIFATPLQLARTIAFEFGYRGLLAPDFVLDISAYNRDKQRDVTSRKTSWSNPYIEGESVYLNTLMNADFGNVRGVDVRLDKRFGQVFYGAATYSYQDARNTGSDPFTYVNIFARLESNANVLLGLPPNPAQAMRLTDENRKHNFSAYIATQWPANYQNRLLANTGIYLSGRLTSGLPYSPLVSSGTSYLIANEGGNANLGTSGAALRDHEIMTARLPWQKSLDMRAQKGIRLNGWNTRVFVDIGNIPDMKNQIAAFQTSGDVVDEEVYAARVQSERETLGGGALQDRMDLSSLSSAGAGVRNAVDLYLLQKAEARFGNGDKIFTADEQIRAFKAGHMFLQGPQDMFSSGRRMRIGFELSF